MLDLKNVQWPGSPLKGKVDPEQLKEFLRMRCLYEKSAFVREGHFEVRSLNPREFTTPIPDGESAVTALVAHPSGHVYGATSGKKAHLFFYNPAPDADACAEIGVITDDAEICSLVVAENGIIYGAGNRRGKAFLLIYKSCGVLLAEKDFTGLGAREAFDTPAEDQLFFSTIDPCHSAGTLAIPPIEPLEEPVSDMVYSHGFLWLHGAESGRIVRVNPADWHSTEIGKISAPSTNKRMLAAADGKIYLSGLYGKLYQIDGENIRPLAATAPSLAGRELYNVVTAWTEDKRHGILYGGTSDGILFRLDRESGELVALGKPTDMAEISGMAMTGGKVYALSGRKSDCVHLGCYQDETREMRDLGCVLARSERPWQAYTLGCMVCGWNGALFLGENDRIGHLFIYYPLIV